VADEVRSFSADEEPEVEVWWEGEWRFGLLAEWALTEGRWVGTVRFNVGPGRGNRIDAFDQDLVRQAS
jgi:hypothetical protein